MSTKPSGPGQSTLQGTHDLVSEVDLKEILVMDIGSRMLRFGYSGQNIPELSIPTRFAKLVNDPRELGTTKMRRVCGVNILEKLRKSNESYCLEYPFIRMIEKKKNSFIKICREKQNLATKNITPEELSMDENESMINKSYDIHHDKYLEMDDDLGFLFKEIIEKDLGTEIQNLDSMITMNQGNGLIKGIDESFRAKICEIFFENLKFGSLNFMSSTVSELFASGLTSGITVELSDSFTNICPIYGVSHYSYF
jgi:actin-related protein